MGSKSPPQQTQTSQIQLSPEQQKLFNLALPYAQQYASQPLTSYGGQTIAGFNPTETAAQGLYKSNAAPVGMELGELAAGSQKFMLSTDQLNPESNPYLSDMGDAITRKISDRLTQNVLPAIRAEGVNAGGMYSGGSTRQQMSENLAGVGATREMGDALTGLYGNAYASGLGNINRAIGQNPTAQAQQLFGADVLGAVGGQERAMEQAGLDEALKKWALEQQLPYMRSSEILGLLSGMPGATATTTMTGAAPKGNKMAGAAGGALSGAQLGTMLMPGIGTGVGAVLGGAAGYLMN